MIRRLKGVFMRLKSLMSNLFKQLRNKMKVVNHGQSRDDTKVNPDLTSGTAPTVTRSRYRARPKVHLDMIEVYRLLALGWGVSQNCQETGERLL